MFGVYSMVCDTYTVTYVEHQDMVDTEKIIRNLVAQMQCWHQVLD